MNIKDKFEIYKIRQLQLDPFGVCNAKCWFCPVKYKGNPIHGKEVMSVDLLKKIIKNLIDERDKENGLVHKKFKGFYTAHYNEILLYPHFEELLKICQEYKLSFMVLSNGVPLTPEKIDLIVKYKGVVNGICLNIPAFEPDVWSLRSGINIKQFDKLISNINYVMEKLPDMVVNKSFSIQVNGINTHSFTGMGGWLDKGSDFPSDMNLDPHIGELKNQVKKAKELFNKVKIFAVPYLVDRAGLLDNVMTNKGSIKRTLQKGNKNKKVIGCSNSKEFGGRPFGWIHVNATGTVFLCCNDYDMEIQFGDFKTQELKDFWGNERHIKKIEESYETICRECVSAIYE
jgi:MoaA/NifB/PqqE/SkfB family radical SAM enzyme